MQIDKAKTLALKLMSQNGLNDWQFKFDRAKKRFGMCNYTDKTISLSKILTELNAESIILDTILHEIAHAICGPESGHGSRWRQTVTRLGGAPERCYKGADVKTPPLKYTASCPACNNQFQAARKSKVACLACCKSHNGGKFSSKFMIEFRKNT